MAGSPFERRRALPRRPTRVRSLVGPAILLGACVATVDQSSGAWSFASGKANACVGRVVVTRAASQRSVEGEGAAAPMNLSVPLASSRRVPALGAASGLAGLLVALALGGPVRQASADLDDFIGEVETVVTAPKAARRRVTGAAHEQLVEAAKILKNIQSRWDSYEAKGALGASQLLDEVSGLLVFNIDVKVPAGNSVGVDVEGCTVNGVSRADFGWKLGDTILKVNGVEVSNRDELTAQTQLAKNKNVPFEFVVRRLTTSPFITLERACNSIYSDSDPTVVLPEPSDVQKKLRELKFDTGLAQQKIGEVGELKPKLDELATDVEIYADA